MVKLDPTLLRYLNGEDFKVLTSVEMGMRNHELVPGPLVNSIASLKFGGCGKVLVNLTKNKLTSYERGKTYDGYRLTYAGYDFLALNVMVHRDVVVGVGNQIGVGKESDVYICEGPEHEQYAVKFHRLGRTCFRKVREKRDYTKNKTSWLYSSRKAAQREFDFLKFMHGRGMPVPRPIDANRHIVVMELVDGRLLNHYTSDSFEPETRQQQVAKLYEALMDLILAFANETRVVHGDFNEFNILIKPDLSPVIIDLPQMVRVDHEYAFDYFERDVECIRHFFVKRFNYESAYVPQWDDVKDIDDANCKLGPPEASNEDIVDEVEDENRSSDSDESQLALARPDEAQRSSVKQRVYIEITNKEKNRRKREAAKLKNIKGDANYVRRRRKTRADLA